MEVMFDLIHNIGIAIVAWRAIIGSFCPKPHFRNFKILAEYVAKDTDRYNAKLNASGFYTDCIWVRFRFVMLFMLLAGLLYFDSQVSTFGQIRHQNSCLQWVD